MKLCDAYSNCCKLYLWLHNNNLFISHFSKVINLDVIVLKDIKHSVFWLRAVSSVGRASRLHRGGQRFESFTAHQLT